MDSKSTQTTETGPATIRWRRFWPTIGIRGMMLMVLVIGGGLGWELHRVRVQREAVAVLEKAGFGVSYRWYGSSREEAYPPSPLPVQLVDFVGQDHFRHVYYIDTSWDTQNLVVDDAIMEKIGRLDRVELLTLDGLKTLTDEHLIKVSGLKRLRSLFLQRTGIQGPGLVHLRGMTDLRVLLLGKTPVHDEDLAHLASLVSLRVLELENCRLITDRGLAHLKGLVNLEHLTLLGGSQITTDGLRVLRHLPRLEGLTLGGSLVDSLETLAPLEKLDYVNLRENRLSDSGLRFISDFKKLSALELYDERISDLSLERIGKLSTLSSLSLAKTDITDAGLVHLANKKFLWKLDLSQTNVSDKGIAVFKGIGGYQCIDFRGTKVTPAGLKVTFPSAIQIR